MGAVPLSGDTVSQLPPSAVLFDAVHCKVPVPAFLICSDWDGGVPPGARVKVSWPGRLSR